ncbi:DUF1918 domain-containing protein [Dactylosporangium sp. NPDC049742]|uniref:DUF1918 domain-containing protein n=1 Tax=Dactylosporangium sp. NPDC049742 TaxID=3154737 RepID=UPI00344AEA1A
MEAKAGDRLIEEGKHVGDHRRIGVITESGMTTDPALRGPLAGQRQRGAGVAGGRRAH